ncbi:MAG: DNA-packaging protein [Patescibacteria group bacterium]|nr:DNA-packaging protein [Patescibacteria group bacterium]
MTKKNIKNNEMADFALKSIYRGVSPLDDKNIPEDNKTLSKSEIKENRGILKAAEYKNISQKQEVEFLPARRKRGRPKKDARIKVYSTITFKNKMFEYLEYCQKNNKLPTIAGFVNYVEISRPTYRKLKQKNGYKKAIEFFENLVEDTWVQALVRKNPTGAMFYLKNSFREFYSDTYEHQIKPVVPILGGATRGRPKKDDKNNDSN